MTTVDKYDLRILEMLQQDATKSHADLGETIHLSASQISRRIQRLEQTGVIAQYAALLDPAVVGLGVQAFVYVSLERHGQTPIREFEKQVQALPEILECFSVTGEADYILKIVARDLESFSQFMMHRITILPGMKVVRSNIALQAIKKTTAVPLDHVAEPEARKQPVKFSSP